MFLSRREQGFESPRGRQFACVADHPFDRRPSRAKKARVAPKRAGGVSCDATTIPTTARASPFETMSKRRKGFSSETRVKRGRRIVGGDKELLEKLGRNDLCPCHSGLRFQALLPEEPSLPRRRARRLLAGVKGPIGVWSFENTTLSPDSPDSPDSENTTLVE